MPAPFYPSKPASPSPLHSNKSLSQNILRIVLGDVRNGGPTITLYHNNSNKINPEKVTLILRGLNGQEYSININQVLNNNKNNEEKEKGIVRPDCWFDFLGNKLEDLQLLIEICIGQKCGKAIILGSEWNNLKGIIKRALVGNNSDIIGVVVLDYIVIKPFDWSRLGENGHVLKAMEKGDKLIMKEKMGINGIFYNSGLVCMNGNKKDAKSKNGPIFAGHRGVGSNRSTFVQENTLLSFVTATRGPLVKHVELDIQLTKDGHPVIFHDYFVGADENGRGGRPIYSLTLQEWKEFVKKNVASDDGDYDADRGGKSKLQRTPAKSSRNSGKGEGSELKKRSKSLPNVSFFDDTDNLKGKLRDELPTLKRICRKVPKDVGLLIEVKYPPPETARDETIPYPEKNLIVDETLYRIFKEEQHSSRSIMFLTFDPDVAAMLNLKQKVYPVYFLNSESREDDTDLLDPRCTTADGAISFAESQSFDGLVLLADILLEDESLIGRIHASDLKLMTYGSINMTPEKSCRQIELGVDGIIADNIGAVARECSKIRPVGRSAPRSSGSDISGLGVPESVYGLLNSSEDVDLDDEY